jgi:hypothetical protein
MTRAVWFVTLPAMAGNLSERGVHDLPIIDRGTCLGGAILLGVAPRLVKGSDGLTVWPIGAQLAI